MKVGLTAQWGTQEREGGALELCRQLRTSPSEGRAHRAVGYTGEREGGALELCRQLRTSPSEGRAHHAVRYTGERGRSSGAVSPTEDVTQ